ncbi:MAG: hypothetical protein FWG68_08670 [Defluviitaleaceae bacterium]|nr:hypothetical protein [Defluviitaleaceae bacterium]
MIIAEPRKYTYEEMKREFKGNCVCAEVVERDERNWMKIGIVLIVAPMMDTVFEEAQLLEKQGSRKPFSTWSYENFVGFPDGIFTGIVQVVSHEDD